PAMPGIAMRNWLVRLMLPVDMRAFYSRRRPAALDSYIRCRADPADPGSEELDVADFFRHVELAARHQLGVALHLVAPVRLGVIHRLVGALDGRARRVA